MKTIIITGAANGLGRAIAEQLKNENLILIDFDAKTLEKTAKKLGKEFYVCDVSVLDEVKATFKEIFKKHKQIDCLINCAGLWIAGEVSNFEQQQFKALNSLERIQKVMGTNLFAIMATTSLVVPVMKKQGHGQIININSVSGLVLEKDFPVYNATKTGATQFRKAISADMEKHNIKITDIHPGLMNTTFFKHAKWNIPQSVLEGSGLNPADVAKTVEYIMNLPPEVTIPSLEIKHIKNN